MLKTVVGHVRYRVSKIADYEIIGSQPIGYGGYGCVFEVKRRTMDKQFYALKVVQLLDR